MNHWKFKAQINPSSHLPFIPITLYSSTLCAQQTSNIYQEDPMSYADWFELWRDLQGWDLNLVATYES